MSRPEQVSEQGTIYKTLKDSSSLLELSEKFCQEQGLNLYSFVRPDLVRPDMFRPEHR